MEILDLYDDNGNKLNETIERGVKPDNGKNIMLAIVFIRDKDNKFLIQKTSIEKGSKYATTGGHVSHNEMALDTITREVKEELGLNVNRDLFNLIKVYKISNRNCIFSVFELNMDSIELNKLNLQKEEVDSVYLYTKEEIIELIDNGNFLESHGNIFKMFIC